MGEPYLELSVAATPETTEGLADFLFAEGALGLILEDSIDNPREVLIRASFPGNMTIDPIISRLKAYQHALTALHFVGVEDQIALREIPATDWGQRWKEHFVPLAVGRRLIIAPSWEPASFPKDRVMVRIDPGMSFGTGHHPTTRLCLEALEAFLESWTGPTGPAVLDVGTGTGILAIAARLLGAGRVIAIDTDREACQGARKNFSLNDVTDQIELLHGGIETLGPEMRFDLALANLDSKGLCPLFVSLAALLRSPGRLVASGILVEEEKVVTAAARASGFRLTGSQSDGEWVCLDLICAG